MLDRLFRRRAPQLPTSSAELAEVLRASAPFADTDDARNEYIAAADALDRAIASTRAHGDEPTRDALAYALGRAELNLKDQLVELIEVSKDTHLLVQGQGAAVDGLRAEFHNSMQQVGERVSDNTLRIADLEQKVAEHDQSRDQSIEDRRLLRQDMTESQAHRTRIQHTLDVELPRISAAIRDLNERHGGQITAMAAQLREIQQLLEIAGNHDHDGSTGAADG